VSEKRWLEADHRALSDQLTAAKSRVDILLQQSQKQHASLQAQIKVLTSNVAELTEKLATAQAQNQKEKTQVEELERKLSPQDGGNPRILDMDKRLRTMADHLLQKTTQIERLSSERSSLKLQLEQETTRSAQLEVNMKAALARANSDGTEIDAADDLEIGATTATIATHAVTAPKSRRVAHAAPAEPKSIAAPSSVSELKSRTVSLLDTLGARLGTALRRYPTWRLGFVLYIIVLHLWNLFVFTHLFRDYQWVDPHDVLPPGIHGPRK